MLTVLSVVKVALVLAALIAAYKGGGIAAVKKLAVGDLLDLLSAHKADQEADAAAKAKAEDLAKRVSEAISAPKAP